MRFTRPISIATLAGALMILAGCQEEQGQQAGAAFPPPQVAVVTVEAEAVPITNELPGRIAATRTAEVRPRVAGIVVERVFEQGSMVQQGDVLYRIDPAPFQVQVDSAEATLRRAKAVQMQARQAAERQEQLRRSNVASVQQYDDALAQLAQADADVAIAEAGLASAKLNLEYAEVKAPISGRIGRALITEGALVSANGENLATIQQLDPVYADFTQPATDLIRLRKALEEGDLIDDGNTTTVKLVLDDGTLYAHEGRLLFSEAAVDASTGQVTLRGEFPNPDGDLLPGMYVRVQIEQGVERNAVLVPQQAVQRDGSGKALVYIVNAENKTDLRPVTIGRATGGSRWVVTDGLKSGERIIVEGFQKVQPGGEVVPTDWKPAAAGEGEAEAAAAEDAAEGSGDAAPAEEAK